MNTKRMLKVYIAPKMETMTLELEEGIAAGSSYIIFNGPNDAQLPEVEGWKDGGSFNGDLEI